MKVVVALIVVAISLGTISAVNGQNETKTIAVAKKTRKACPATKQGIRYYRERTWKFQEARGVPRTQPSRTTANSLPCGYAEWVRKLWKARYETAKKKYNKWASFYFLPETNDWRTAVRITQRVYPNTEAWLLSCSKTEGGWGGFVMNREGSGVGGNMQMYPSTYFTMMHGYYLPSAGRYFPGAWIDAHRKGFHIPASADSWYSPLGQALASAYGKLNGRGGEWHGSGC